ETAEREGRGSPPAAPPRTRPGNGEPIPGYKIAVPEPAGSVISSARDLAKWARFHLGDGVWNGKRLVSAASFAEPHMPQNIIRMEGAAKAQHPQPRHTRY